MVRSQFRSMLIPGRAEASYGEHRAIFEALQARDPERAEQAMRRHIATLRETIRTSWDLVRN